MGLRSFSLTRSGSDAGGSVSASGISSVGFLVLGAIVPCILTFCLPSLALAASSLPLDPSLNPSDEAAAPEFELLSSDARGVHVIFRLPALQLESYDLNGEVFHTADVPGGQLHGDPGEPCLPSFTRLVAIPNQAGASLRVVAVEEQTLSGFHLLPMQDEDVTRFLRHDATYARDEFLGGELVTLGDPWLFRDLRVVPLTFRPVRYNPRSGQLKVAQRIELEVVFAGTDLRNSRQRARAVAAPGFEELFDAYVINYGREEEHPRAESTHRGTWVCISRNDSGVLSRLQPLIDWRKRMGYDVVQTTTAVTGTSPSSIQSWLQTAYNTWESPPEYVTIVGDASGSFSIGTFYETYSGCGGEGDHPFVQLDGTDLMPDAFIGRLSAETYDNLQLIVNKIVGYESTPDVSDQSWFGRACLVGDPYDSGVTCVQVQQWLKQHLRQIGYTSVDTVFSSPFVSRIRASLNQGATYFGYRGFWGVSGWDNGDISALTNGWKMVFAINLTCGTGSFAHGTSMNEAWLRAGAGTNNPTAGIGSIATATDCTHTRYNNCFYVGAAYGLFWGNRYQLGPAGARGKVEMINSYADYEFTQAARYVWWNNLIGDPATEIWTGYPEPLTVTHPASVSIGANVVTIGVSRAGGQPVAGSWVHLFREGQISVGAPTDEQGMVTLPLSAGSAGTVLVTVTGHNLYPYRGSFEIQQQDYSVGPGSYSIDDDDSGGSSGNNDHTVNPGETIEMGVFLTNFGTQPASGVTLQVTTADPEIGILTFGPLQYGTIPAGGQGAPPAPVLFRVHHAYVPGEDIRFDLEITSGAHTWDAILDVPVSGPDLVRRECFVSGVGGNGILDPGEEGQLVLSLRNDGGVTAQAPIRLELVSESYAVRVVDRNGQIFESVSPSSWKGNWDDPFRVAAPADCVPGLAPLRILVTTADGIRDTVAFVLPVGSTDSHDPTGPDAYGYLAYDQTDTGYSQRPVYSWVEINPYSGGPGTDVGLTDNGIDQDDSRAVDLPFPFTYYGQTFTRATICSNGWMAMGWTHSRYCQNYYLPGALAAPNMIAPFWDDLYQYGNGRVYHWHDSANHRYVVAWDNLRNEAGGSASFEIIFYDPAHYPTATGDGEFVFQYELVNNYDSQQMYSTVGIQNEDHTAGMTYHYFNQPAPGATSLAAGLAVKFTTGAPGAAGVDAASDASGPRLALLQSEPNPCQGATTVRFQLDRTQPIALRVFDVDGRLVRTLLGGSLAAGPHAVSWLGDDEAGLPLPAGIYFYSLEGAERTLTRKLLRLQ